MNDKVSLIMALRQKVEEHDTFHDIVADLKKRGIPFTIKANHKGEPVIHGLQDARGSVVMRQIGTELFHVHDPLYAGGGVQVDILPYLAVQTSSACTAIKPWIAV